MGYQPTVPESGGGAASCSSILSGYLGKVILGSEGDSYQAVLKKMHYTYKSQEYCFEEWKNTHALKFYHKSNICGVANEDNGADLGDGGGPLFCPLQADPNKMVQIGIVSWEIVSEGKFPTSFTSVKHYLPWIREKLKELS